MDSPSSSLQLEEKIQNDSLTDPETNSVHLPRQFKEQEEHLSPISKRIKQVRLKFDSSQKHLENLSLTLSNHKVILNCRNAKKIFGA